MLKLLPDVLDFTCVPVRFLVLREALKEPALKQAKAQRSLQIASQIIPVYHLQS